MLCTVLRVFEPPGASTSAGITPACASCLSTRVALAEGMFDARAAVFCAACRRRGAPRFDLAPLVLLVSDGDTVASIIVVRLFFVFFFFFLLCHGVV